MEKQAQLTLVGLEGPVAGRQFTFDGPDIFLGRGQGCHVIVPSSYVSRRHCALHYREGRWELEDLGARNPARLNGGPTSGPIRPGDVLVLANARFRIEMPTAWSADERPTQVINRDTALMKEYAEVLRELKLSQGRRKGRVARTPHVEAEEPSVSREMSVSIATTPPSSYPVPRGGPGTREIWLDRGEQVPDAGLALAPPGFRVPGPPEPTPQELALLSEVASHPGGLETPDVLSRYVVMRSFASPPPRLQLPVSPPPIAGEEEEEEVFDRAAPIYTDAQDDSLGFYENDEEPTTVYFTPRERSRARPWPWVVALAGLAVATLGIRSCTTESAQREASSPPGQAVATSALNPVSPPAPRPAAP